MTELRTDRLWMRGFVPGDLAAVHAYASDPEVCRYTDWGPNSLAQTQAFLDEVVAVGAAAERDSFTWAISADGDVVGACSVTISSVQHRRGLMGYVLARPFWGRGYATEAAASVLRFAFRDLRLERVEATCRPDNVASQRVLVKIGMEREGLLRSHMQIRGERRDSLLFAAISP